LKDDTSDTPAGELSALKGAIKDLGPLGTTISAVVGVGVIYVIGGMVAILRLRQAHLPVEQGLDVTPREQLLVIGAREVVLVLALSLVFFLLLDKVSAPWSFLIVLLLCGAALLLAPVTPAGLVWPVAILLVLGLWLLHEKRESSLALLAIPVVILVAVASRYDDPPARFFEGNVWTDAPPLTGCRLDVGEDPKSAASSCGLFLGVTDDNVYLGFPGGGGTPRQIVGLPKSTVEKIVLTEFVTCPDSPRRQPRGCARAPRLSIVGRVARWLGGPEISCNPLECWIDGTNHGSRVFG
jgi:hypothetical protein